MTVTIAYRVAPGREAEFHSWATTLLSVIAQVPGYLGGGILASGETGAEWHLIHRFDDDDNARAWEISAARTQLAARADQIAEETGRRGISGLKSWFDGPETPVAAPPPAPQPPPKWKLWFVNMSAVFPPVLIFNLTVIPYLSSVNPLLRTLALCLTVTAIVTWVLMPRLQRFLKKWLYPPLQAFRGRHKRRAA
ncbi:antibiotic biosynthesis monooxygenase [Streptomyces sp. NBC_01537]|uniref:antibiotic biosynthesis monooxygenase n=1 Tax=Streptomyces sp. NBC_01537 TaxID=2903896 RepID=UPI00387047DF